MNRFHNLTVKNIKKESNNAVSVSFDVPDSLKSEFKFKAGQYLDLKKNIKGNEVIRSYSIWKAPHENEWSVLVKQIDNGVFSTYVNESLSIGDQIEVSNPEGNFSLKEEQNLVFIAAGSGITPVISMIKDVLYNDKNKTVTLFYINKTKDDIIFNEEIKELNDKYSQFNVFNLLTRQKLEDELLEGRLDNNKCQQLVKSQIMSLSADGYYLCGPEEMIFSVKDFLESNNVDSSKIRFELFQAPTKEENKDSSDLESYSGNVSVLMIVDDEEYEFMYNPSSSDSLLDAGIENGVDLPFSCKGGVCCTCKAKITEGNAKMKVNYALTDDEVEDGYVLTCQSHALSSSITVDFDE